MLKILQINGEIRSIKKRTEYDEISLCRSLPEANFKYV